MILVFTREKLFLSKLHCLLFFFVRYVVMRGANISYEDMIANQMLNDFMVEEEPVVEGEELGDYDFSKHIYEDD
jgi:hypothetical protein